MLRVEKGIEPSLILWENLGFNKVIKWRNYMLVQLIALILVGFSLWIVYLLKLQVDNIKTENPKVQCSRKSENFVDENQAYQAQLTKEL